MVRWQNKRKKRFLTAFILLGILVAFPFYYSSKDQILTRLYIEFDSNQRPTTLVRIQDLECSLTINLGNKFPLVLSKDMLAQLDKEDAGFVSSRDLYGEEELLQAYTLKTIQLGDISYSNVLTIEKKDSSTPCSGEIGRPLLNRSNLLLDFGNSTLILSDSLTKLKAIGYEVNKWAKGPMDIQRTGTVIEAALGTTKVKLSFGTACGLSMIRDSFAEKHFSAQKESQFAAEFRLEAKNLGTIHLHSYPITEELKEIDGSIGMDFLKSHTVYFDYRNKVVYLE